MGRIARIHGMGHPGDPGDRHRWAADTTQLTAPLLSLTDPTSNFDIRVFERTGVNTKQGGARTRLSCRTMEHWRRHKWVVMRMGARPARRERDTSRDIKKYVVMTTERYILGHSLWFRIRGEEVMSTRPLVMCIHKEVKHECPAQCNVLNVLWGANKYRADSRFAPSQWETALLCNAVPHWLGASLESTLILQRRNKLFHVWTVTP